MRKGKLLLNAGLKLLKTIKRKIESVKVPIQLLSRQIYEHKNKCTVRHNIFHNIFLYYCFNILGM